MLHTNGIWRMPRQRKAEEGIGRRRKPEGTCDPGTKLGGWEDSRSGHIGIVFMSHSGLAELFAGPNAKWKVQVVLRISRQ